MEHSFGITAVTELASFMKQNISTVARGSPWSSPGPNTSLGEVKAMALGTPIPKNLSTAKHREISHGKSRTEHFGSCWSKRT